MALIEAGDKKLVEELLRGEEAAFKEFFDSYFPALYRFAASRLDHDPLAAEEVAQATICQAIRHLRSYRGEASLFTWLCTFCRHEIYAFRGARRPQAELIEDLPEVRAALESLCAPAAQGPEAELTRREISRWVEATLDNLPRHYGQVLEWKYLQDLSVKEIADRLGLAPKAAESLLTRARLAFKESFAGLGDSEIPWLTAQQRPRSAR